MKTLLTLHSRSAYSCFTGRTVEVKSFGTKVATCEVSAGREIQFTLQEANILTLSQEDVNCLEKEPVNTYFLRYPHFIVGKKGSRFYAGNNFIVYADSFEKLVEKVEETFQIHIVVR